MPKRTASDKVLPDKGFTMAKNPKYEYQRYLASMVSESFDKKLSGGGVKTENMLKQELAKELHKPFITKFEK